MADTVPLACIMGSMLTRAPVPAETYVLIDGVDWESFVALTDDDERRAGCRFAYDEGTLEIMAPGPRHEGYKKLLARLVEAYTLELGIPIRSAGSTQWKRKDLKKALEPDECYYLANELTVRSKLDLELPRDPPPDLAIEVEVSRGSKLKLRIYAALGVREVWRFNGSRIAVHSLQPDGSYRVVAQSQVLPQAPLEDFVRFLGLCESLGETELLRRFRDWVRERFVR